MDQWRRIKDEREAAGGSTRSVEEFVEHFENQRGSFHDEYKKIDKLMKDRDRLKTQIKNARLYLKPDLIDDIQEYLDLDQFWYTTADFSHDTFYLDFFKNICDNKKYEKRKKISRRVLNRLGKLISL